MMRSARLMAHIKTCATAPIVGVDDCGPWVARWIEIETGRKVNFPHYTTAQEAYALAAAAGGLAELVSPLLAAIPLWTTKEPEFGDVAIVELSDRETAVIFAAGGNATVRTEAGPVTFFRPRPGMIVRAWTVPER